MQPDDSLPLHFGQRRHAPHAGEPGLAYLVAQWEARVADIAQDRFADRDEYLNVMDGRRILAERLADTDVAQRAAVLPRLEEIDRRFRSLVLPTDVCAWGAMNAYRHRWTREREWWYWTRPRHTTFWPEHPELAVLERVLDLEESLTRADTQLTLITVALYTGAVTVTVAITCGDKRLIALLEKRRQERSGWIDGMRLSLTVTDDRDARYESALRGASYPGWRSGEPFHCEITYTITPALAADARQILMGVTTVEVVERGRVLLMLEGWWEFTIPIR
jgi:hypothetical protein